MDGQVWEDHPRSRGVYPEAPGMASASWGSSPLARGLPRKRLERARDQGIIPARAGFTRKRPVGSRRYPDHPRSRGVYSQAEVSATTIPGSSPLARGLPSNSPRG